MKQFEQVVFMEGADAEEPLEILDADGAEAAIKFLQDWQCPGEHETRDEPGAGSSDYTYNSEDGLYILTWNTGLEYIGLEFEVQT